MAEHKRGWLDKEIPFGDPRELTIYETYRLSVRNARRLRQLKYKLGTKSLDGVLSFLINTIEREGAIPVATYNTAFVQPGTRPVIITGESGAGKTTAVKALLNEYMKRNPGGNVFVLDISGEYADFAQIDLGQFFGYDWGGAKGQRIRFIPNTNVDISKSEAATIFSHLNFIKNSGALKDWVFVVEEGHRFANDINLRTLLIEARKFVSKLIVVTTDWKVYDGITLILKPESWIK
ncbi:MAG: DUF87 domain-containing protein [Nitrososphaerota archaeon]|jgi:hypothetical protein|nr:DUF87 domain-containing protein [Nitrososphaerota archaeon]MDG6929663.1 DUF87 domain-containing protein [Nitrososphaerota archaeon]